MLDLRPRRPSCLQLTDYVFPSLRSLSYVRASLPYVLLRGTCRLRHSARYSGLRAKLNVSIMVRKYVI